MGCVNSTCMLPPKNEVEIDIDPEDGNSKLVLLRPEPKGVQPQIYMKDYIDQLPDLAKLTEAKNTSPYHGRGSRKEEELASSTRVYSDIPFEVKLAEMNLRIGKSFSELNREFEAILDSVRMARRDFLMSTSLELDPNKEDRIFTILNQWKSFVYEDICKKTGEIKNIITYNSNGKSFTLSHEVEGWKDVTLLKGFCDYADIKIDESFYKICKTKLHDISCLTIIVWIEIVDTDTKPKILVGCNIIKPSDRNVLVKFLEGTVEKRNIITWFDANNPVPLEFGMFLSEEDNELVMGFYFFDATPNLNLSRALTGLQAYGADLNDSNIDIFKSIPGEELKIFFGINKYGAQKVRLVMNRLPSQTLQDMLEKLDKKYDPKVWESFKILFQEMTLRTYFVLEYSGEGFTVYCTREVGAEIGSKVCFDDYS